MTTEPTPQKVLLELKEKRYKPIYFLQGEESYYINQISNYIAYHIIPKNQLQLNLKTFYDKNQTLQQIILYAQQVPIVGNKKIIIIKEAQKLLDLQKKNSQKLLIDYIKQPSQHTLLVFNYKNKILNKNTILAKALLQQNTLLTCKTPYPNQFPGWIQQYTQEKGYSISRQIASELQKITGDSLSIVTSELDKLFINLKRGSQIDSEHITTYIQPNRGFTPVEVQQALVQKNAEKIYHIIKSHQLNPKKNPIYQTISYLTNFFTKLLLLHHNSRLKTAQQVATYLQISPYQATSYLPAKKCITLRQTLHSIHLLHQADLQLKGIHFPSLSEEDIFKELMAKLLQT